MGNQGIEKKERPDMDPENPVAAETGNTGLQQDAPADGNSRLPPAGQPDLPQQAEPFNGTLAIAKEAERGSLPLDNPQHELVCAAATGWGGTGEPVAAYKAYKTVYKTSNDATARVNAARLMAREEVKERCAWMRAQLAASIMLDKRAVRAGLYKMRMDIIEKTINTKNKPLALMAARDIERSLGLDKPEVEAQQTTTSEDGASNIGDNVEAIAEQHAKSTTVTVTTVNQ